MIQEMFLTIGVSMLVVLTPGVLCACMTRRLQPPTKE